MYNYLRLSVLALLNITFSIAFSQSSTNSPYTRYGLGEVDNSGFGFTDGMGSTTIALRDANRINYLNPASHNAQDSMSFIWDFGIDGNYNKSITTQHAVAKNAFSFDHIAVSFPIAKHYFASAGLLPYSNVGYNIKENIYSTKASIDGNYIETVTNNFNGEGNINQIYFANSFGLLKNHLNFGVNASYLFGSVNNNIEIMYPTNYSSLFEKKMIVGDVYFNFGFQGVYDVSKNLSIISGLTYAPAQHLNTEYNQKFTRIFNVSSVETVLDSSLHSTYNVPARYGVGISFNIKDQIQISTDYTYQDWSNTKFLGSDQHLDKSHKICAGLQIIPERYSYRSYFKRINYRVGGFVNNSYLTLNNHNITEIGLTAGLGFPFKNNGTMFNIAYQYAQKGTTTDKLISITSNRITLSLTLYDFWFIKRKYD